MSMKLLMPILFVCLSVGVSWGWTINSPEEDASYFDIATIACSGTGFPDSAGVVEIKNAANVIMDSKGFTWEEETDWDADMEPPQSGWTEGLATVELFEVAGNSKTRKRVRFITIVEPE